MEDSSITEVSTASAGNYISLTRFGKIKIKFRKTVSVEVCVGIIFKQIHILGDFAKETFFPTIHVISKIIVSWRALF